MSPSVSKDALQNLWGMCWHPMTGCFPIDKTKVIMLNIRYSTKTNSSNLTKHRLWLHPNTKCLLQTYSRYFLNRWQIIITLMLWHDVTKACEISINYCTRSRAGSYQSQWPVTEAGEGEAVARQYLYLYLYDLVSKMSFPDTSTLTYL